MKRFADEELEDIIHPERTPAPVEICGYTLIRPHTNKVVIVKDGEILAEKEINGDRHYENFLENFRRDGVYRAFCTGGSQ